MFKIPQHPTFTAADTHTIPTNNNHTIDGSNADILNTLTKVSNTAQAVVVTAITANKSLRAIAPNTPHASTVPDVKKLLDKYNALIDED
jgi:hypothetical protein